MLIRSKNFDPLGIGSFGLWSPGSQINDRAARLKRDVTIVTTTVGVVIVGAAVLEFALIPGIVLGSVAVVAPRLLPKRKAPPVAGRPTTSQRNILPQISTPVEVVSKAVSALSVKQAFIKTVTFRVIVTTLDFTTNFLVLGELTTAAGLSGFALVAGPVFYFVHETAWNYLAPLKPDADGLQESSVNIPMLVIFSGRNQSSVKRRNTLTMSRALAKTITFRSIASTVDFSATYFIVGDVATALALTSFGFVLGPFVYWGHEKAWEIFATRRDAKRMSERKDTLLLAPPAMTDI